MEQLEKRISYLRGLADGLDVGETSREGKIMNDLIEVIDDLFVELRALHARLEETEEYIEAVDEDLSDLELLLYEDDDELYETVDDGGREYVLVDENGNEYALLDEYGDPLILIDEESRRYYDLDDSEDAYVYQSVNARHPDEDDTRFDVSYEIECPNCHEVIYLHEGVDRDGYRHYVIETYREMQPINPT